MLDHVVGIAETRRPGIDQAIQGLRGGPGELGAGIVVLRIFQQRLGRFDHRVDDGFDHPRVEFGLFRWR